VIDLDGIEEICNPSPSKIIMLVIDGLGGIPDPKTGYSELEVAKIPNLDRLARESACGRTVPILHGITPGSGPGHLSLFGYDPFKHFIGRGILEALGIEAFVGKSDVAARGNFCTVDADGLLVDRRAGRIPTEQSMGLCEAISSIDIPGVELSVLPVQDHRFVLVMSGDDLSDSLSETDPQILGKAPLEVTALSLDAQKTCNAVNRFIQRSTEVLHGRDQANMVLLRGFSMIPDLPSMATVYKLSPAAIAAYPMYRGLAQIVGMNVIKTGKTIDDEIDTLEKHINSHDFFYLHYKPADSAGEDGNFEAKVAALEEIDARIPRLLQLNPDVLVVAGDHATPSVLASHSWHPVPVLIRSRNTRGEGANGFTEKTCLAGTLGTFPAKNLMLLVLSHAGKLSKYGP